MSFVYEKFPLTKRAERSKLINGLLDGKVSKKKALAALKQDAKKRPWKKPIVASDTLYPSVTEAAIAELGNSIKRLSLVDKMRAVNAMQQQLAKMCDDDCWEGYYWADPND